MSERESGREEVLARVKSRQLRVVGAAALLGVSYRQGKRLWKRYREEGAAGALRAWVERYGVPQALSVDWKNLYQRPATGLAPKRSWVPPADHPWRRAAHREAQRRMARALPASPPPSRAGPATRTKPVLKTRTRTKSKKQKGDTSNELNKGTFLKSLDS